MLSAEREGKRACRSLLLCSRSKPCLPRKQLLRPPRYRRVRLYPLNQPARNRLTFFQHYTDQIASTTACARRTSILWQENQLFHGLPTSSRLTMTHLRGTYIRF